MEPISIHLEPEVIVSTGAEPLADGRFEPSWESLKQYVVPDWFRDAKFGIWAHWGPQCEPEAGDWYARAMYEEGSRCYDSHVERYGHPSEFGFKDVINRWKAENWNPEALVALYKRVGAQYFFAMANHHDNLDLWDSRYQEWNSPRVGPGKNIIEGWARAARENDLAFGVSVHAAHSWTWYETAQRADTAGDKTGIPYDGHLTKEDGVGTWWEGLDPQDLYAQNHPLSENASDAGAIHRQWHWGNGVCRPSDAFCQGFYDRTMDLINKYQPDLIYFDDTALPLWPVSDAGLKIAAHFYNENEQRNQGDLRAVLFGKILNEEQLETMVWDIERGVPANSLPLAWQTCTCIGSWHYDRGVYERDEYKSGKAVIHMLADIVSKNGNLLLSVPLRADGSLDEKEVAILEEIAAWMDVNKESIFGTRPWKVFGEGPASAGAALSAQGFNEGQGKPFSAEDVRFTSTEDALYVITLGRPMQAVSLKSLGGSAGVLDRQVCGVQMLGSEEILTWTQDDEALTIIPPSGPVSEIAAVFKLRLRP